MIDTDLVISINIYKSLSTLRKQLSTIKQYVACSYIVVLNCDQSMLNTIKDETFESNIIINPEIINKNYAIPGTFCRGFVSNMIYTLSNINFKYFLILSGRTIFYRTLHLEFLDKTNKSWSSLEERNEKIQRPFKQNGWCHWPRLLTTNLASYYLSKGYDLYVSAHEGLLFHKDVVLNIVRFLNNNKIIADSIFVCSAGGTDEFSMATIAMNETDPLNLHYGYTYIGNGVSEGCNENDETRFTRKIPFD